MHTKAPTRESRRDWIKQAVATGAGLALLSTSQPASSTSKDTTNSTTPPNFEVPVGACDCHVHVFPDETRFPFYSSRTYTPPHASIGQLLDLQDSLRLDRVVIVTPSVYGNDNTATLYAIRMLGKQRARGVGVVADEANAEELAELKQAGISGLRINLEAGGVTDPVVAAKRLKQAVSLVADQGMHLQIYASLSLIAALEKELGALPVPAVFDHFAGAQAEKGVSQPGFDAVLSLVRAGKAYVKLSAAYRSSTRAPDYEDVAPLAAALIKANPERMLWGTDWPHPGKPGVVAATDITKPYAVDNGRMLNLLGKWAPSQELRKKILVDNPKEVYGFA
ncbi:4-sulfomuconolactone hydrolase [Achromobacter kerstersii]|uniref:4-sulfomuconolactone hydrolase n=2 Tax=Achromobacter kerstersii TaxID=1353890 RepID=A0A6S6Z6K1_9BURK|nr:4-sulfomuconolactone hydrolase [Achromobacter kerstersii]